MIERESHVGPVVDQGSYDPLMTPARGECQSVITVVISAGYVRASPKQPLDDLAMATCCSRHQRSLARAIFRVDVRAC